MFVAIITCNHRQEIAHNSINGHNQATSLKNSLTCGADVKRENIVRLRYFVIQDIALCNDSKMG